MDSATAEPSPSRGPFTPVPQGLLPWETNKLNNTTSSRYSLIVPVQASPARHHYQCVIAVNSRVSYVCRSRWHLEPQTPVNQTKEVRTAEPELDCVELRSKSKVWQRLHNAGSDRRWWICSRSEPRHVICVFGSGLFSKQNVTAVSSFYREVVARLSTFAEAVWSANAGYFHSLHRECSRMPVWSDRIKREIKELLHLKSGRVSLEKTGPI